MIKFKAEIEMSGVKLKPKYARKLYTVALAAQQEIRKAQKLHRSYNVPAIIHLYEKDGKNNWILLEKKEIESLNIG